MKETTLTIKIKVSDDNNHVEIVDSSTSEPICALVLMGIFKSMSDFAIKWNEEHKKQRRQTMTYKEYMQLGLDKCPANKAVEEIREWTKANDGRSSIVVLMDKAQSYTRGTISGNNPVACLALEMTTDENFRELIYNAVSLYERTKNDVQKNQIRIDYERN